MRSFLKHLSLSILPLILLAALSVEFRGRLLANHSESEALAQSRFVQARVGDFFDDRLSLLQTLASTPTLQSGRLSETLTYLLREEQRSRKFERLYFDDLEGNVYRLNTETFNVRDRSYFPDVMRGEIVISEAVVSRDTERSIMLLIVPVHDSQGRHVGALAGSCNMDHIISLLESQRDLGPRIPLLLGENVIAPPGTGTELVTRAASLDPRVDRFRLDETAYRVFRTESLPADLSLLLLQPEQSLTTLPKSFRQHAWALLAVALLFAILLAYGFNTRLVRPIETLLAVQREFGHGRLEARAPETQSGEIGELQRSFNTMAEAITERERRLKEALEKYEESRSLVEAIVEHSPALIYVKNLEGLYQVACPGFFTVTPDPESVLGCSDFDLMEPEEAEAIRANDLEVLESGEARQFEEVVGDTHFLSVKFPLLDNEGHPYAVCGISTDLSERRQLEHSLSQALRMESIGRLAGGVAHDFNNFLTVIIGCAELAKENEVSASTQKLLDEIIAIGDRAAQLVSQLLSFARKKPVEPRVVELNEQVRLSHEVLSRMVPPHVGFELELCQTPLRVTIDPVQLDQLLTNLVVNAGQSIRDEGRVCLRTRDEEEHVVIEVEDTGEGISEETRRHIFEPFFTTKKTGEGTGLGLATCLGIVKTAGGDIAVHSIQGKGTTFRVTLPAARAGSSPAPEPDQTGRL